MDLPRPLNTYIDHTQLKPHATQDKYEKLLDEAIEHSFEAVCVSPYMAVPVRNALNVQGYPFIKVCTVVDFPNGNNPLEIKAFQVDYFTERGIDEIDFVLNYAELKNKNYNYIIQELRTLGDLCKRRGAVSKCIVETCYLDQSEKTTVFNYIKDLAPNVDFIKTSTGFGSSGASVSDVETWSKLRGSEPRPLIKAAGGIKDLDSALAFINAGADRLGMSASVEVMEKWNERSPTFTEGEEKA